MIMGKVHEKVLFPDYSMKRLNTDKIMLRELFIFNTVG